MVNVTIDIEDGWSSRITSSIADPIVPNTQAFLLDIDVFKEEDLPLSGGKLWETIDKVRAKKNRIFEACITQKTRELFE